MARRKPIHRVLSEGVHERFDEGGGLPRLIEPTLRVEAAVGREFGFVIRFERARGLRLGWEIDHPGVPASDDPAGAAGEPLPPFRGEEFVPSPTWDFYLGDAFWEPLERMAGPWRLSVELDGTRVHRAEFVVSSPRPIEPEGPQ